MRAKAAVDFIVEFEVDDKDDPVTIEAKAIKAVADYMKENPGSVQLWMYPCPRRPHSS